MGSMLAAAVKRVFKSSLYKSNAASPAAYNLALSIAIQLASVFATDIPTLSVSPSTIVVVTIISSGPIARFVSSRSTLIVCTDTESVLA